MGWGGVGLKLGLRLGLGWEGGLLEMPSLGNRPDHVYLTRREISSSQQSPAAANGMYLRIVLNIGITEQVITRKCGLAMLLDRLWQQQQILHFFYLA